MTSLTAAIPVFNGERFLPATLECLARQTRRPDRLVVFDNGSTDSTPEIVRSFDAIPTEFRRNESNLGVLGNANRCLGLAGETRFLHLIMADDLVTPRFYERLIPELEGIDGPALAYSFNDEIDQHGRVIGPAVRRPTSPTARRVPLNEFLGRQAELATVLLPGVVLKTDFSPPLCLFDDMPQVADGLFLADWARRCGRVVEVPDYLCHYRLHPFNASSRHVHDIQSFVVDEWLLARRVAGWIDEPAPARLLRRLKLRCLLGARTQVKMDMVRADKPGYAREIRARQRELGGLLSVLVGWAAVRLRDAARRMGGRPRRAEELKTTTQSMP